MTPIDRDPALLQSPPFAWPSAAGPSPLYRTLSWKSVQTMAAWTGVSLSQRRLEEILPDAAQDLDACHRPLFRAPAQALFWWRPSMARAFP
jgi:hypothetical protein